MARRWPSRAKARKMLHDGTVRGRKLTKKQRGLFGLLASGKKPRRVKSRRGRTKR